MAIKEKNQAAAAPAPVPGGVGSPEMNFAVNPAINARLDKFMADNPEITAHYTKLVRENPERAIRSMALNSMFRRESLERQVQRQMPQVREWVKEQPGLEQQIEAKIRTTNPLMRMVAFVREAVKAKANIDFAPRNSEANGLGKGMSV
jgi:hypothetical protein